MGIKGTTNIASTETTFSVKEILKNPGIYQEMDDQYGCRIIVPYVNCGIYVDDDGKLEKLEVDSWSKYQFIRSPTTVTLSNS